MELAVIGLGKLGSVLAAVCAEVGHRVVGVDVNTSIVEDLIDRRSPFSEPGLQELIASLDDRLSVSQDIHVAVRDADATLVVVPTPSHEGGGFSNQFVLSALEGIGGALRESSRPHTVVVCSTVSPESCDGELIPALEQASGRRVGESLGFVYSPQFIALGSIIKNLRQPDMVLIGSSGEEAADVAYEIWRSIAVNEPSWQRMSLSSAEIVKLAVNAFVTMKISFANMLDELCEQVPGAHSTAVTDAVGADSRIGRKYLKGALGYGGPCFPRDNRALEAFASSLGVEAPLPRATDSINDRQVRRVVERVASAIPAPAKVAVLGLAYKPDTPVCEASQGVEIANELQRRGYGVSVHDPQALDSAQAVLSPDMVRCRSLQEAVAGAEAVVIATAWAEYEEISLEALGSTAIVIDPWSALQARTREHA